MSEFLFNGKITISSGYNIRCKITGAEGSARDNKLYILLIPGGPGYTHKSMEATYLNIIKVLKADGRELPHFIFFDPLSCGESDQAQHPDLEYTIPFFTRIAAEVVEAIQKKFAITQIKLNIIGRSFGSIVAMHFPTVRDWSHPDSEIYLSKIFSLSGPIFNHGSTHDKTIEFIKENFAHLNQENIERGLAKLHAGNILSRTDYIREVCINLAPLYSSSYDGLINYLPYLAYCPKALEWVSFLLSFNPFFEKMYYSFTGCNFELMNHFFRNDYDELNLPQLIQENIDQYKAYKIFCLVGSKDYISFYNLHVKPLIAILPETLSGISFINARHQDLPKLTFELIAAAMNDEAIESLLKVNKPLIKKGHLATDFYENVGLANIPVQGIFQHPQQDENLSIENNRAPA